MNQTSKGRLSTCHPDLQRLFNEVDKFYSIMILEGHRGKEAQDKARFYYFSGIVLEFARRLNIKIRWGGNWKMDGKLKDNKFQDLVHFELIDSQV